MWPNWNSTNYYIFYRRSQWTIFPVVLSDEYANEPPAQTLFFFKKMIIIIIIFILILVAKPDWNRNQWTSRRSATGGQFCLFFLLISKETKIFWKIFSFVSPGGVWNNLFPKMKYRLVLAAPQTLSLNLWKKLKFYSATGVNLICSNEFSGKNKLNLPLRFIG